MLCALMIAAVDLLFAVVDRAALDQPADTQPQEPETPADSGTSDGSTEAPSISLPTQEEVEQAASSLYNAASTILDAIYNAASQNDAA